MAKKTSVVKKIEMVPAVADSKAFGEFAVQLPSKDALRRISAAPLLQFKDWPIGVTVSGSLTGLIQNLAKDKKMKKACVLTFQHQTLDRSFMVPMTGTIRAAMREYLEISGEDTDDEKTVLKTGDKGVIGKVFFITRRETTTSKKYNKEMFNFDVDIMD